MTDLVHARVDIQDDSEFDDAIEALLDALGVPDEPEKYYDPNQPRDELGRWTDSEGMLQGNTLENGANPIPESPGTSPGGQRQLPGVPRAGATNPDRAKEKTILASGTIVSEENLGGGANKTIKMEFEGDGSGVFKPADGEKYLRDNIPQGEYYLREAAASDIAEVLGMDDLVPPTVIREIDGRIGSVAEYRNDDLQPAKYAYDPFSDLETNDMVRSLAFDYILGNNDRHNGNWLLSKDNPSKFTLIDHGLTLPQDNYSYIRSNFGYSIHDRDARIVDGIGDQWDDKWPQIEKIIEPLGRDVTQAAKKRFDDLIATKNNMGKFDDLPMEIHN